MKYLAWFGFLVRRSAGIDGFIVFRQTQVSCYSLQFLCYWWLCYIKCTNGRVFSIFTKSVNKHIS